MSQPKGRICNTVRPVHIGEVEIVGTKPRLIVRTRSAQSRNWSDRWHKVVKALGLDVVPLGDGWFDVTGTVAALKEIQWHPAVISCQLALDVRVPWMSSGSGPEKVRNSPARPKPDLGPNNANVGKLVNAPSETECWEHQRDAVPVANPKTVDYPGYEWPATPVTRTTGEYSGLSEDFANFLEGFHQG